MINLTNNILSSVSGTICSEPEEVEVNGHKYHSFNLKSLRLGGYEDIVEILTPPDDCVFDVEQRVRVVGFIFAYYKDNRVRLCLYSLGVVNIKSPYDKNLIMCAGTITRPPVLRTTPAGKTICDIMLAVNNELSEVHSSYIPCIAWYQTAEQINKLSVGDTILLVGRLQSRDYVKLLEDGKTEVRTTKELSINSFNLLVSEE